MQRLLETWELESMTDWNENVGGKMSKLGLLLKFLIVLWI